MKKALIALAIAVCVLTQAVCCISEEPARTQYRIDLFMNEKDLSFDVYQSVYYTNQTGGTLSSVCFSLPANCFRRESTLPYDNDTLVSAFPNGYAPGGAEIHQITVNGQNAEWAVSGENECFLRVGVPLLPGESCEIAFSYTLLLSENNAFLGVSDTEWRLTGFYPSVSVYEDGDFAANALTRTGKYHYSEVADFEITVTVPADYEVAAGSETTKTATDEKAYVKYAFTLENAREAALCISRRFHLKTAVSASGVRVYAYGQDRALLSEAAENAARAIDEMEKMLVPFPRASLTLVESSHAGDSLRASGIVLLSKADLADEYEIAGCAAKMYFGELVQPNPAMEGWLIDGMSEYMSLLYIRNTQGGRAYNKALNQRLLPALQLTIPGGLTPVSETHRFQTRPEYETVVCLRAAAALHEIHLAVGEDNFLSAVREYLSVHADSQPVSDDFVRALNTVTGENRADTVYSWLYTIGEYANETMYEYD